MVIFAPAAKVSTTPLLVADPPGVSATPCATSGSFAVMTVPTLCLVVPAGRSCANFTNPMPSPYLNAGSLKLSVEVRPGVQNPVPLSEHTTP